MEELKVGFWKGFGAFNDQYPDVTDHIDPTWTGPEKEAVIVHVGRGKVKRRLRGYSRCRICRERNGSVDLHDGVYVWPSGLLHYIETHNVKPPQEFIDHIIGEKQC
ncbi:hypothetical protein LCGC14_1324010 [marine sediment metagenome]|uniref:DUF7919 domain-containing protein n=1 Tax=marine sediment metagenome TaxID=412755 RepID=A0A0F9NL11_9ZZZZ